MDHDSLEASDERSNLLNCDPRARIERDLCDHLQGVGTVVVYPQREGPQLIQQQRVPRGEANAALSHGRFELRFTDGSSGLYLLEAMAVDVVVGDLNDDGEVGAFDLALLLGNWGPCADLDDCPADLNGDGTVGPADLAILLGNWG